MYTIVQSNEFQTCVNDFVNKIYCITNGQNSKCDYILFSDYMKSWLEQHKLNIQPTTYSGYLYILNRYIVPYFEDKKIFLQNITDKDIENYYAHLSLQGLSNNSILKHHANIYTALKRAYKDGLITNNVAMLVERPQKTKFIPNFYTVDEINNLLSFLNLNKKLKTPIMLACLLGLRRSEIIGLKWDCVDFKNNVVSVRRKAYEDKNTRQVIISPLLKNNSSYRNLTMPTPLSKQLKIIYNKQQNNKNKKGYNLKNLDCVCCDDNGNLISPNYLTTAFPKLLNKCKLQHIRFHDLRHSCASMLLALGFSLKDIQEWLGHGDYSTTANIYLHLDIKSQKLIASKLSDVINIL